MNGKKSTAGNSVLSVFTGNTGIIGVLVILCVVVALATDKFFDTEQYHFSAQTDFH